MKEDRELVIRAVAEDIPKAVEFIGMTLRSFGISSRKALGVELAVEEACTNVVLHGYRGEGGYIKISCSSSDSRIAVNLEDAGVTFDPTKRPGPNLVDDVDKRPIGGLGIYLIRSFVDGLGYEFKDGKNNLAMEINRS